MAAVSLDGPSEVEPLRRLYGHDLEHWLIDHLDLTAGETALELASGLGAMCVRLAEVVGSDGRAICSDLRPERVEATRRTVSSVTSVTVDARVLDMLRLISRTRASTESWAAGASCTRCRPSRPSGRPGACCAPVARSPWHLANVPGVAGAFAVAATVDPSNTIPERSESNNAHTAPLAVQPAGPRAYVADQDKAVHVVELNTGAVVNSIPPEEVLFGVAVAPGGRWVYVAGSDD